jgi:hypothetical protein
VFEIRIVAHRAAQKKALQWGEAAWPKEPGKARRAALDGLESSGFRPFLLAERYDAPEPILDVVYPIEDCCFRRELHFSRAELEAFLEFLGLSAEGASLAQVALHSFRLAGHDLPGEGRFTRAPKTREEGDVILVFAYGGLV